jgi:mannose-6-phosphate isomerase-like protein (cupin superfamily)
MTAKASEIDNKPAGEWLRARPEEQFLIRVPTSATNGSYSLTEIISSPGDSTLVHRHTKEEEHTLVLEGTARILYGDKTFDATPGTVVTLTRGIPHAWENPTDTPVRFIVMATPGGCEEALRLIAESGDKVDILAITNKFGVEQLGPPLLSGSR